MVITIIYYLFDVLNCFTNRTILLAEQAFDYASYELSARKQHETRLGSHLSY